MLGVRIGEKHTYNDWGLLWLEPYKIEYPAPVLDLVKVPGADGVLDLTEAVSGRVRFETRKIELRFELPDEDYYEYETRKMEIAAYLHGQRHNVWLDTDDKYYYSARLSLDVQKSSKSGSTFVITGTADPYKFWQYSSLDDWLWDPFDFDNDWVFEGKDLAVTGERTVVVPPTLFPAVPWFTATPDEGATLSVTFGDYTVELPPGERYSTPYISFGDQENVLVFHGEGIVDIDYTGGVL
jgi:hypothetical protein